MIITMGALNLFLAAIWLALGLSLILWSVVQPETGGPQRPWLGALALVLFGYNLLRWWLGRLRSRYRDEAERRPRPRRSEEPPDPTFDVSDEPR